MQKGEIVYLPKPSEGDYTVDVEEMRPITLLPELGKLTNRVLARRMTQTLMQHPDLLEGAQRGFLGSSIGQCINAVLDVFEDHHERKSKRKELFTVSYDLRKTYDCTRV